MNRLCKHCGKPLVPIGSSRHNGAGHLDWSKHIIIRNAGNYYMEGTKWFRLNIGQYITEHIADKLRSVKNLGWSDVSVGRTGSG